MKKTLESVENYLETILILGKDGNPVRSIDIANELEFSKPTISIAMKNLRTGKYVDVDANGFITLTDSGREIAQRMYERHTLISDWLIFLGVSKETALRDACKMEHYMSEESFFALQRHINSFMGSADS